MALVATATHVWPCCFVKYCHGCLYGSIKTVQCNDFSWFAQMESELDILYQGDIVLNLKQARHLFEKKIGLRRKRAAGNSKVRKQSSRGRSKSKSRKPVINLESAGMPLQAPKTSVGRSRSSHARKMLPTVQTTVHGSQSKTTIVQSQVFDVSLTTPSVLSAAVVTERVSTIQSNDPGPQSKVPAAHTKAFVLQSYSPVQIKTTALQTQDSSVQMTSPVVQTNVNDITDDTSVVQGDVPVQHEPPIAQSLAPDVQTTPPLTETKAPVTTTDTSVAQGDVPVQHEPPIAQSLAPDVQINTVSVDTEASDIQSHVTAVQPKKPVVQPEFLNVKTNPPLIAEKTPVVVQSSVAQPVADVISQSSDGGFRVTSTQHPVAYEASGFQLKAIGGFMRPRLHVDEPLGGIGANLLKTQVGVPINVTSVDAEDDDADLPVPTDMWTMPISYRIYDLDEKAKLLIKSAVQLIEQQTCVRFKEMSKGSNQRGDKGLIGFIHGERCWSWVGKQGGEQEISLSKECLTAGMVLHLLGHALGMWHHNSHSDHGSHLIKVTDNIATGMEHNFLMFKTHAQESPFDAGSIMNFMAEAFSKKRGLPTLLAKNSMVQPAIGQRDVLSFYDVWLINKLYCSETCRKAEPVCQHEGYQHPNHCSNCLCPAGFVGPFCEYLAPSINTENGRIIKVACNETGEITEKEPAGVEAWWLLQGPASSKISLAKTGMDIAYYQDYTLTCPDWLSIHYTNLAIPNVRVCGKTAPDWVGVTMRTETNEILFTMKVSSAASGGFRYRYTVDCSPMKKDLTETPELPWESMELHVTWGEWSNWSQCDMSRCGCRSSRIRTRICHLPKGFHCRGEDRQTISCGESSQSCSNRFRRQWCCNKWILRRKQRKCISPTFLLSRYLTAT
ncbi:PREDICTED: uncharacterized protein LOC106820835 isoform X2 [Priapulus caudatus]|uniref:Metalloendopeptidase n=1 Tax=Priapulus caudatus TaxID=37621 RepID=A0ABM1F8X6_PRICU|nr:PREDICTED: uncharacterized protein LOC106820835 isoform X2 [Priapulus caudatus]